VGNYSDLLQLPNPVKIEAKRIGDSSLEKGNASEKGKTVAKMCGEAKWVAIGQR